MQRRQFIGLALAGGAVAAIPWALRRRATTKTAPSIDYHASDEHLGFDGQGNAYRLDARRNLLVRLGAAAAPVWSRGKTGLREGELNGPTALAFDAKHRIHVADAGNGRVQVFEADGSVAHLIGRDSGLVLPRDLAFDAKGNLYVCDTLNHRVEVFDETGRAIGRIGSFGQGRSELNGPRALAFASDGALHVVDAGHARIQVYSADGKWIGSYGGGQGESRSLLMPGSIAFGADGRAHVADATAGVVSIFDQGKLVERFVPRDAVGRALSPVQLTFDPQHRLRIMGTPAFAA